MKNILFYNSPAKTWEAALPIGSGRLGAMVFGGTKKLRLQLNEISLWSGEPFEKADREKAYTHLDDLRELIDNNEYQKAEKLLDSEFTNFGGGFERAYSGSYQTLGDLNIIFDISGRSTGYKRSLSLDEAVCRDEFCIKDTKISREYFASAADNAIVIGIKTEGEKSISCSIKYTRKNIDKIIYSNKGFSFTGHCDGKKNHMAFAGEMRVLSTDGGTLAGSDYIKITDAKSIVLIFTAATDYVLDKNKAFKEGNPSDRCSNILNSASVYDYNTLKARHIEEYIELFNRNTLEIAGGCYENIPTDERLRNFSQGNRDNALISLFYQFGRYLLISSSRPNNALPANLQGIWCKDYEAPWHCDYHANINIQMNYWCAGPANLVQLTEPLAKLIEALPENGRKTAADYYGCEGWTLYTITNPWLWTSPGWGGGWSQYPLGGAWMCLHLVEYYNFTGDKKLLERFYPVLKENCIFNMNMMCCDADGKYYTNPATSPENCFYDNDGNSGWVCKGTAMDIEMLKQNFSDMITICNILDTDRELVEKLEHLKANLLELKIGKAGQLCEWEGDWDLNSKEMNHRHVSHLFGLHPGNIISEELTPELAEACKKSLDLRGDDGTGWSLAWKINFHARLHDGNRALKLIKRLMKPVKSTGFNYRSGGGLYTNMFDAHPPFQIDGNFGAVSGICEMLLQSQTVLPDGEFLLALLPALPEEWQQGSVKGLKARGNTTVDIEWSNAVLSQAVLTPLNSGKIAVKGSFSVFHEGAEIKTVFSDGITFIDGEIGKQYILQPAKK